MLTHLLFLSTLLAAVVAQDLQSVSHDDDDDDGGQHRGGSIELECPNVQCPDMKCGACVCGPGAGRKRRPNKFKGQTWLNQFGDASGRNYNPKSNITKDNVGNLSVVWAIDNNFDGNGAWSWGGTTTDGKTVYACVQQTQNNPTTQRTYVVARNRATGGLLWRRALENYLPFGTAGGSECRSAPAILGDYIYVSETAAQRAGFGAGCPAQSFRRFGEPANPDKLMFPIFSAPVTAAGRSIQIMKINRHTGEGVWSRDLGERATYIDDPDNMLRTSGSPIAFELDAYNTGVKIPVVAQGLSSSQSTFFIGCTDLPGMFAGGVYNELNIGGGVMLPPSGRKGEPLGLSVEDYRPTDIGRVILYDGRDGREITQVRCGPKPYREGDRLEARTIFPGKNTFQTRHWVKVADLEEGGALNPVNAQFAGRQTLVYRLVTKSRVAALGTRNKIPISLDGVEIQIKPPGPAGAGFVAAGPVVTLVGGADVTDQMDGLVVELETVFTEGSTEFEVDGTVYDLTDPALDLIDQDGQYYNPAVMIRRRLRVGDVLDRTAANEATAWGATAWGNGNPTITYDKHGDAREMLFGCGQTHKSPYEYTDFSYGIGPTERAERKAAGFVEYTQRSAEQTAAAQAYIDFKTPARLQQYRNVLASDESQRAAEVERLEKFGSEDLKNNAFDGMVVASLRPGHVGEVQSISHTRMFDSWTAVSLFGYDGPGAAFGFADFATSYTDLQIALGTPYSLDADIGENPKILYGAAEDGSDLIVLPCKGGDILTYTFEETPGCKHGAARHAVLKHRRITGHAATLGGSNFGSCSDDRYSYHTQKNNDDSAGSLGFSWTTGERGSRNPMSKEVFSFPNGWIPTTSDEDLPDVIPKAVGYTLRYDPRTNGVEYEKTLEGSGNSASCTVNKELLFVVAPNGALNALDKETGDTELAFATNAGFSLIGQHALIDNDIVVLPRSSASPTQFAPANPGTMYLLSTDGSGEPPAHYTPHQQIAPAATKSVQEMNADERVAALTQMFE